MIRGALAALSVVLLAVALLAGLERARGTAALAEAQAAQERGELPLAIAAARVAAEARVPYTSHADAALALLEQIADSTEGTRNSATAVLALRVARQAAEATQQVERARALGLRESALEAAKATELAPDPRDAQAASAPPRPTGIGRGAVAPLAQLAMTLGALGILAALAWVAVQRRLRWGVALVTAATALLVLARLLP